MIRREKHVIACILLFSTSLYGGMAFGETVDVNRIPNDFFGTFFFTRFPLGIVTDAVYFASTSSSLLTIT